MEDINDQLLHAMRERRRRSACEASGREFVPDVLPTRPAEKCAPEEPVVPDPLLPPNPSPEPPPVQKLLPSPLLVRSPEVELECEAGAGSASAAYGEQSENVYLDDIEGLTTSELYRTAGRLAALQEAVDAHLEPLVAGDITAAEFDAFIRTASTIEAAAAVGLRVRLLEVRENLRQMMEVVVFGRLTCTFYNPDIWVVCDSEEDDGYRVEMSEPPSGIYEFRAAGTSSSTVSQDDATLKAIEDALQDLECVYLNEEVTVTCATLSPAFNHTYSPPFLWNSGSYNSLAELAAADFSALSLDSLDVPNALIYTVTKAPSASFAAPTQDLANELATTAALAELNCFFPARAKQVDCTVSQAVLDRMEELDAPKEDVFEEMDPNYLDFINYGIVGNDADTTEGLVVMVPAGMTISRLSQTLADDEATTHARNFLVCRWLSPETQCSCTDLGDEERNPASYFYTEAELQGKGVHLSATKSSNTLTFARGALGSSETGPVTDSFSLCRAALTCVYCNDTVLPRCPIAFDGLSSPAYDPENPSVRDSDTLSPLYPANPLPLVVPPGTPGISIDITSGLPADSYCDTDPDIVESVSDTTANIRPLPAADDCRYTNLLVESACRASDLDPALPAHRKYAKFSGDEAAALSADSTSVIRVAPGAFNVTEEEARAAGQNDPVAYATSLALNMAKGYLNCFFVSEQVTLRCYPSIYQNYGGVDAGEFPAEVLASTSPISYPLNDADEPVAWMASRVEGSSSQVLIPVHPDSVGAVGREAVVEAAAERSDLSKADANRKALAIARSAMQCFWKSPELRVLCGAKAPIPGSITQSKLIELLEWIDDSNGLTVGWGTINNPAAAYTGVEGTPSDMIREGLTGLPLELNPAFLPVEHPTVLLGCGTAATQLDTSGDPAVNLQGVQLLGVIADACTETPPTVPTHTPLEAHTTVVHCDSAGSTVSPVTIEAGVESENLSYPAMLRRAITAGTVLLDCFVRSNEFVFECAPATGGYFAVGARPVSKVVFNALQSYQSQLDADIQAYTMARSGLLCLYTNESQTAYCCDPGPCDCIAGEDPVIDPEASEGWWIWSPTYVPRCQFTAANVATANLQACLAARSALLCITTSAAPVPPDPPPPVEDVLPKNDHPFKLKVDNYAGVDGECEECSVSFTSSILQVRDLHNGASVAATITGPLASALASVGCGTLNIALTIDVNQPALSVGTCSLVVSAEDAGPILEFTGEDQDGIRLKVAKISNCIVTQYIHGEVRVTEGCYGGLRVLQPVSS